MPKTGDAANITAYVSKDFGSVTVLGDTSATEMDATNAKGYYRFDITQTETNADIILVSAKSSTTNIVVVGAPAAIFTFPATGILAPATAGRTLVVDAAGLADANVVKVGPTGSGTAQTARDVGGQLDAAVTTRMASYTQPTGFLAATFPSGTVANTTNITAGTMTTTTNLTNAPPDSSGVTTLLSRLSAARAGVLDALSLRTGTAQAGANGTITLDASASATDNLYRSQWIALTGGTGAGQVRMISGYVGATKVATVHGNWATNPDNTSVFYLLSASDIYGLVLADTVTTVSGNVNGSTATIGVNGLDAAALATDAVTEIVTAVFARAFSAAYGSYTFDEMIKMFSAALLGKVSGMTTGPAVHRNLADSGDVLSTTADADGNRTAVTRTP